MQHERARSFDVSAFVRSLPATLVTLLVVVMAVDILLASQPALLSQLSRDWDGVVAMRPGLAASSQVLAAVFAVASVVITSAVLLAFTRAALSAPHISLAPV